VSVDGDEVNVDGICSRCEEEVENEKEEE